MRMVRLWAHMKKMWEKDQCWLQGEHGMGSSKSRVNPKSIMLAANGMHVNLAVLFYHTTL